MSASLKFGLIAVIIGTLISATISVKFGAMQYRKAQFPMIPCSDDEMCTSIKDPSKPYFPCLLPGSTSGNRKIGKCMRCVKEYVYCGQTLMNVTFPCCKGFECIEDVCVNPKTPKPSMPKIPEETEAEGEVE